MNSVFQNRLRKAVNDKGITQVKLAHMAGVEPHAVSSAINSGSYPRIDTLVKLADKLDVSIDWLLGREGYAQKPGENADLFNNIPIIMRGI